MVGRTTLMKKILPYGKFIFEDGSQILFNRYYIPIVDRKPIADINQEMQLRIQDAKKQWFYKDSNPPWRDKEILKKSETILKAFDAL
jgi:hypothetical protein